VPRAPPNEHCAEDAGDDERADDPRAAPAPLLTFDDPEHESRDRKREQDRAREVGHPSATGSAALDEAAARQQDGRDADRQVDQEHQPPVIGGYEQPAERGTEACGGRGDR
jgi:hypothetical protein